MNKTKATRKKRAAVPEDGILRTLEHASAYAQRVADMSGKKQNVFRVPAGSAAHRMGYRFGTFGEDEADLYTVVATLATFEPTS